VPLPGHFSGCVSDSIFILTLPLFALTIIRMGFFCRYSAGFFRPDHDPPIATADRVIPSFYRYSPLLLEKITP
jgi:hypothetical protein